MEWVMSDFPKTIRERIWKMKSRKKGTFTYKGIEYKNRTACAVLLVEGGMSIADAARATKLTYPTVYVNVGEGKEKAHDRLVKYRTIAMAKKNRRPGDISKRLGISVPKVNSILKKSGVK